jgi:hypothetical protein
LNAAIAEYAEEYFFFVNVRVFVFSWLHLLDPRVLGRLSSRCPLRLTEILSKQDTAICDTDPSESANFRHVTLVPLAKRVDAAA